MAKILPIPMFMAVCRVAPLLILFSFQQVTTDQPIIIPVIFFADQRYTFHSNIHHNSQDYRLSVDLTTDFGYDQNNSGRIMAAGQDIVYTSEFAKFVKSIRWFNLELPGSGPNQ